MVSRPRLLALTRSVVSFPSTSYHEHRLRTFLAQHAESLDLPVALDRWGNVHVRYSRGAQKVRWTFLAHMDHPGFVVSETRGKRAWCRWFGGVLRTYFKNARVRVHGTEASVPGRVIATRVGGPRKRVEWIQIETRYPVSVGDLGTWDLPAWQRVGDRIQTRAADDLVGCAALAALLESLAASRVPARVKVIYTRAEEAGLIGATSLARSGLLDPADPIIAIETSKALAGASIGNGPVLRVGDRMSSYDPGLNRFLHTCAQSLAQSLRGFRFQRCLMDGGLCEASSFLAHGYRATGLALPLGNYHNMGRTRIALEEVSASDLLHLVRLMEACVTARWPASGVLAAADPIELGAYLAGQESLLRNSVNQAPSIPRTVSKPRTGSGGRPVARRSAARLRTQRSTQS